MPKATGRLEYWRLKLSGFHFDVVHCSGIKNHECDKWLSLKTKPQNHIPLEDEFSVLITSRESFPFAPFSVSSELVTVEEPKGRFVSSDFKVCRLKGINTLERGNTDIVRDYSQLPH